MMASLSASHLLRTLVRNHNRAVGITACRNLYTKPKKPNVGFNYEQLHRQDILKTRPQTFRSFSSNEAFTLLARRIDEFYPNLPKATKAVESNETSEPVGTDDAGETAVAQTLFDENGAINSDIDMSTLTDAQLDQVARACLFETSKLELGQVKGLEQYVADMKEDQKEIYFIFSRDDRWHLANSPYAQALVDQDIELLYISSGDEDVISAIAAKGFSGFPVVPVETSVKPVVSFGTVLRADGAHPHWPLRYRLFHVVQVLVVTVGVYASAPFLLLGRFLYLHLLDRIENQKKRMVRMKNRAKRLTGKK